MVKIILVFIIMREKTNKFCSVFSKVQLWFILDQKPSSDYVFLQWTWSYSFTIQCFILSSIGGTDNHP